MVTSWVVVMSPLAGAGSWGLAGMTVASGRVKGEPALVVAGDEVGRQRRGRRGNRGY